MSYDSYGDVIDLGKDKYLNHLMGLKEFQDRMIKVIYYIDWGLMKYNCLFDIKDDLSEIAKELSYLAFRDPVIHDFKDRKETKTIIENTKHLFDDFHKDKIEVGYTPLQTLQFHYSFNISKKDGELYDEILSVHQKRVNAVNEIIKFLDFLENNICGCICRNERGIRLIIKQFKRKLIMMMSEYEMLLNFYEMLKDKDVSERNVFTMSCLVNQDIGIIYKLLNIESEKVKYHYPQLKI